MQVLMVDAEKGAIVVKGSVPGKPGASCGYEASGAAVWERHLT